MNRCDLSRFLFVFLSTMQFCPGVMFFPENAVHGQKEVDTWTPHPYSWWTFNLKTNKVNRSSTILAWCARTNFIGFLTLSKHFELPNTVQFFMCSMNVHWSILICKPKAKLKSVHHIKLPCLFRRLVFSIHINPLYIYVFMNFLMHESLGCEDFQWMDKMIREEFKISSFLHLRFLHLRFCS